MKSSEKLILKQISDKIESYSASSIPPSNGWIAAIRTALGMSRRQFAERLGITIASAREVELREQSRSITLKSLSEAAKALNMKVVYGLVPIQGTLEETIDKQVHNLAQRIVKRTQTNMSLEDQAISRRDLEISIKDLASQIKSEMPRYLWD